MLVWYPQSLAPFQIHLQRRQLLSLDHITQGRVGWNLVTSMTDAEAQNHSLKSYQKDLNVIKSG